MDKTWEFEWGKLGLCVILLAGGFAMVFTGKDAAGIGIIGTVTGYIFGNGRLAGKGQASIPAIGATPAEPNPPAVAGDGVALRP